MSDSLLCYGLQTARLHCPRNSPGKNSGINCHDLLQGIFLTQGLNLCLLCLPALVGGFTTSATWEAPTLTLEVYKQCILLEFNTYKLQLEKLLSPSTGLQKGILYSGKSAFTKAIQFGKLARLYLLCYLSPLACRNCFYYISYILHVFLINLKWQ